MHLAFICFLCFSRPAAVEFKLIYQRGKPTLFTRISFRICVWYLHTKHSRISELVTRISLLHTRMYMYVTRCHFMPSF